MKYHFIRKNGVIVSRPSKDAVNRVKADLFDIVYGNVRNQRKLIDTLNVKLKGWGNTYKFCDAKSDFYDIDVYLQNILMDAVSEIHPTISPQKLMEKYWYTDFLQNRYFSIPKEKETRVIHLADIVLLRYTPVRLTMNPFIDDELAELLSSYSDFSRKKEKS